MASVWPSRRCEKCGGRTGLITCYRTILVKMGVKETTGYMHTKCFERVKKEYSR